MVDIVTLKCFLALSLTRIGFSSFEVFLGNAGYNFYLPLEVNNLQYKTIVDTGNPVSLSLTQLDSSIYNLSLSGTPCEVLVEDAQYVTFLGLVENSDTTVTYCPSKFGDIVFDESSTEANFTLFSHISSQNPTLHDWNNATGDIGMAYCGNGFSCKPTVFQSLLANTSTTLIEDILFGNSTYLAPLLNITMPLIFGLDLNNYSSASSVQMGELKSPYNDQMAWVPLQMNNPTYHQVNVDTLMLGSINLFVNWSVTWPALIDTGSVCLSLPEEMFGTFLGWLNTSAIGSADELPAFSSSAQKYNKFYIPLKNLVLDNSTVIDEATYGVPIISIGDERRHICVIKGQPISSSNIEGRLHLPFITFGTKTLESIYFAADYTSGHVGFSSKISSDEAAYYNSVESQKQCLPRKQCIGQQKFLANTNNCDTPSCSHYFYVEVDNDTQTCQFSSSSLGAGFFFLSLILLIEVGSFFILQCTTYDFLTRTDDEDDVTVQATKLADAKKIDILSRAIGRPLSFIVDLFLIYCLRTARPRRRIYN
jgi:hypothetical protein